jgi:hypothetical protein
MMVMIKIIVQIGVDVRVVSSQGLQGRINFGRQNQHM